MTLPRAQFCSNQGNREKGTWILKGCKSRSLPLSFTHQLDQRRHVRPAIWNSCVLESWCPQSKPSLSSVLTGGVAGPMLPSPSNLWVPVGWEEGVGLNQQDSCNSLCKHSNWSKQETDAGIGSRNTGSFLMSSFRGRQGATRQGRHLTKLQGRLDEFLGLTKITSI